MMFVMQSLFKSAGGSDVGDENFSLIVSGTQKLDINTAKTEQVRQW